MHNKPVVVFTFPYGKENFLKIEQEGYEVVYINEEKMTGDEMPENTEVLVCYDPFAKVDISKLDKLKFIQLVSKGINQAPREKIKNAGIIVANNGNATSIPIAEWIITMILMLLKNSSFIYKNMNDKIWNEDRNISELAGKRVIILGTGGIAIEAASRLKAFGVEITGINRSGRAVAGFNRCCSLDQFNNLLPECDILVSAIPATSETKNLINKKTLSLLKKDACFINISRGSVVNEDDLIEKLNDGSLRGASLDVFKQEPLSSDSPLWDAANIIITPHNSYLSDAYRNRVFEVIFKNLKKYKSGKTLDFVVDFEKGY